MIHHITKFMVCLAACISLWPVCARNAATDDQLDSLKLNHHVIFLPGNGTPDAGSDSVRRAIDAFYYDQFRHFQDPAAPYFLFLSKDSNLAMGIGGCVRMRGWYDWGGAIPANGFVPALIQMEPDPTHMRHLGSTPAGSSLFFRVLGRKGGINYQLYIEANFNGYQGRDLHLKKAYAILNDWTVGYANSTFSDPMALPPTVDAQGPNNKMAVTDVLVRWMKTFRNRWTVAVSAETPAQQVDVQNDMTAKCDEWLPDFAAFLQYEWDTSSHVRLAGIMRTLPYRDLIAERNHNVIGYGLQLSTVFHPAYPLTFYGTFTWGHGTASLGGDMLVGNYDLVSDPDTPGRLYAPAAFGWCAALQYNFRPNLFVSATLGQSRYLPDHQEDGMNYKYGLYGAANVFWNLTPRIQVGAEFNIGKRQNFNGMHRWARRVGAMCQFSF